MSAYVNETIQTLMEGKSMRVFEDQPISPAQREIILRAAAAAPTAGNQQLYTILEITDEKLKRRLSETCDHQPFIAQGKLVLAFLADCRKWYKAYLLAGSEPRKPGPGDFLLAVDDALIAAQNTVVAAESMGIGACYIGDIMEQYEIHREILGLPEYVFPAALLVMGWPTPQQKERPKPPRADMSTIVYENHYPDWTPEGLEQLMAHRLGRESFADWVTAFCNRKYNSDFSREMSRSVAAFLRQLEQ